jgi:competence protein ComEC
MSFAAALALIAAYQFGLPWRADADTPAAARMALWGGREIFGLIMASLVAGLATTPYSAFHFHRLAPYGVLANLLAMPVISVWVMPMGILGVLTMPFGFDAVFWKLMGDGVDWMIMVVLWVAHLPGAVGHIHAFGTGPLLLMTAGLLLLCLLRSPLRWSGGGAGILRMLLGDGAAAPRCAGRGRRAGGGDPRRRRQIVDPAQQPRQLRGQGMADGDGREPTDPTLREGVRCDAVGCIGRLAGWRRSRCRSKLSPRIARAPPSWSARARRRAPAPRRSSIAIPGGPTAPWRCVGPASTSSSAPRGRQGTSGPGRGGCPGPRKPPRRLGRRCAMLRRGWARWTRIIDFR